MNLRVCFCIHSSTNGKKYCLDIELINTDPQKCNLIGASLPSYAMLFIILHIHFHQNEI